MIMAGSVTIIQKMLYIKTPNGPALGGLAIPWLRGPEES